jgi:hypothetical protein
VVVAAVREHVGMGKWQFLGSINQEKWAAMKGVQLLVPLSSNNLVSYTPCCWG